MKATRRTDFDLISMACCMMNKAPVADDNNRGCGISSGNGKTTGGRRRVARGFPFSIIRTMTVGPGIAPDLLTLPRRPAGAGGSFVRRSRAGCLRIITAGGESRPAPRTKPMNCNAAVQRTAFIGNREFITAGKILPARRDCAPSLLVVEQIVDGLATEQLLRR